MINEFGNMPTSPLVAVLMVRLTDNTLIMSVIEEVATYKEGLKAVHSETTAQRISELPMESDGDVSVREIIYMVVSNDDFRTMVHSLGGKAGSMHAYKRH